MDRERLKEVHQTDLTESRVNEDFVDWLKNSGATWLLVMLVGICGYLGIIRYKQHRLDKQASAWAALNEAELPGSFEDVAAEFPKVGQLSCVAWLRAADELLRSVQVGKPVGALIDPATPGAEPPPEETLSAEQRTQYLDRADDNYDKILDRDDGSLGMTLFAVNAMNGKAAVAESRGDTSSSAEWYERAAERAGDAYPGLATQARQRAETATRYGAAPTFLTQQEISQREGAPPRREPIEIDDSLREYLLPDEAEADDVG